jgi:hypothetical protein
MADAIDLTGAKAPIDFLGLYAALKRRSSTVLHAGKWELRAEERGLGSEGWEVRAGK